MEGNLKRNSPKYILPALFDIKPVDQTGGLDMKKVEQMESTLNLKKAEEQSREKIDKLDLSKMRRGFRVLPPRRLEAEQHPRKAPSPLPDEKLNDEFLYDGGLPEGGGVVIPGREMFLPIQEVTHSEQPESEKSLISRQIFNEINGISGNKQSEYKEEKHFEKKANNVFRIDDISIKELDMPGEVPEDFWEPLDANNEEQDSLDIYEPVLQQDNAIERDQESNNQIQGDIPFDLYQKLPSNDIVPLPNNLEPQKKVMLDPSTEDDLSFRVEEFYFPEVASQGGLRVSSSCRQEKYKEKYFSRRAFTPKSLIGFLAAGLLVALVVPGAKWVSRGFEIKKEVMANSLEAYQNLLSARDSLEAADWQSAEQSFNLAHFNFLEARQEIQMLGEVTLGVLEKIPGGSLVSSGHHLVQVGEYLAKAGETMASTVNLFSFGGMFNVIESSQNDGQGDGQQAEQTLTDKIVITQKNLTEALAGIRSANMELDQVDEGSLPVEIRDGVVDLKGKLPLVEEILDHALDYSRSFLEFLGHDNPRQYLLLFQNNSEIRATGGFIGTYGVLSLDQGEIKDLFIDGVFNADGQLHEKVIPPRPIQKISTAWSMHDANWFADFPTSAKKITWFYEKTGGPTVDGVIALTPVLVERLLDITGPVAMPEYNMSLTAENFVELVQYEVEIDYDKDLNRPKKILADFTPRFIEALSNLDARQKQDVLNIVFDCLAEKHALIYFNDSDLEELVLQEDWGGELVDTDGDYLSVVSSNINGFKTDRMIEESIEHHASIQEDGSIIVDLVIRRKHKGGETEYDWWNRVNANYLRVYLPKGTELVSAKGHTLEAYSPPVDYEQSGFKPDPMVKLIEDGMVTDERTGIQIFEESGKTVFGTWAYVSPGETVEVKYTYKLPFKIDLRKPTDSYSLVAQKQAGTEASMFVHSLEFPEHWYVSWKHPEQMKITTGKLSFTGDLKTDKFLGATFEIR